MPGRKYRAPKSNTLADKREEPLVRAYRWEKEIRCGRCGEPFPLDVVNFRHLNRSLYPQIVPGDNIIWRGKFDEDGEHVGPSKRMRDNIEHGHKPEAGTAHLEEFPGKSGRRLSVPHRRGSGCPRTATCSHCEAPNEFNPKRLRLGRKKPQS